jgi:hypothetical protein
VANEKAPEHRGFIYFVADGLMSISKSPSRWEAGFRGRSHGLIDALPDGNSCLVVRIESARSLKVWKTRLVRYHFPQG